MKKCLFLILLVAQVTFSQVKTTTIYFIRHAEKMDTSKDTSLSPDGIARAQHWNEVFSEINFDAVYSTNYNRTQQTATPTAKKNNLTIKLYDPKTINLENIKKEHLGQNILIVGHSNSTPDLVNKLIGATIYSAIDESVFGNLYIVTINDTQVNYQLLKSL
jgi:2,3-bisphosphoglycerate-dependent phosphoglycerate mutase